MSILLWYTISVFYLLLLSFWEEHRIQSLLQVITDLVLVTLVVYATGGVDSSLNFLYPLVIIVACILLPRVWAYLTAALAFILYVAVLELTYFEIIPSYSTTHPGMGALQAIIFVNLFGYLAVAYLAGLLAAKLRQVDVKLKHTSGALEDLQALHENIIQSISGGLITTGLDGLHHPGEHRRPEVAGTSGGRTAGTAVASSFSIRCPWSVRNGAWRSALCRSEWFPQDISGHGVRTRRCPAAATMGYVYTFDDLTEIRRLEREVRMQDRLAAVGRLAAAIAHEIRNPLTSIAGSVSMLSGIARPERRTPPAAADRDPRVGAPERHHHRLPGLLARQAISDSPTSIWCRCSKTRSLCWSTAWWRENTGIRIERQLQRSAGLHHGGWRQDQTGVLEFLRERGSRHERGGVLTVSLEQIGDDWQINFADTGPGMSPQLIEKIFEPFQSQFEGGTGLGLAIVYQIVQAHEGKVWARSKVGEGSVFVLRLRRTAAAEQIPHPAAR